MSATTIGRARPSWEFRERKYWRADMPRSAWKNGREPREWRTRRRAVDDLIAGLDRYLKQLGLARAQGVHADWLAEGDAALGNALRNAQTEAHQWAVWAARLSDPHVTRGFGPAPDHSIWAIRQRMEYGG